MKILLIVDDYMPTSIKVAAKMMHELACELLASGHKVSVLTPDSTISTNLDLLELDGINIYRFKSGQIKNVSKIKRALNETLLSLRGWYYAKQVLKENKHDFIVYYSPSIFFGPLVYKIKKLWNVKAYLILRDFFPQWAIDNKILTKNSLIAYYFQFFEKLNYKVADRIGVMSEKNLIWFKNYYKTDIPVEVLYNWANTNKVVNKNSYYRKSLGLENKVVYFYGGNLGKAQDMMNIVRLAKNMENERDAHFVLVGAGDEFRLVEKNILDGNIKNITLLPSVNQEDYKQMLVEFDVGLFTLSKNHKTHNFPGKLLGYMVQEMPILGSINPENDLADVIESYSAGLISVNGEDNLLYKNAKELMNVEIRRSMGKNASKLLEKKFSVASAVEQLLKYEVKT